MPQEEIHSHHRNENTQTNVDYLLMFTFFSEGVLGLMQKRIEYLRLGMQPGRRGGFHIEIHRFSQILEYQK